MNKNLILIQCKDEVGLVSVISKVLARNDLNITAMREFVDEASGHFFARIEFTGILKDKETLNRELRTELPEQTILHINPKPGKKIAILVTKEYHCLGDTLVRDCFNTLSAKVCCVIGNYDTLR